MSQLLGSIKAFVQRLNQSGVPVPLIRINGTATLTGTMVFISFNTCLIGQIGKISRFLDGVDLTQANYLFGICLAAYLGRRIQTNGSTKSVDIGNTEDKPSDLSS